MGLLYKGLSVCVQSRLDPCPNNTIQGAEGIESNWKKSSTTLIISQLTNSLLKEGTILLLPLLAEKRNAKKCTNKNTSGQMSCSLAASFPILSSVVKNFNRSSSVIIYITHRQHVLSNRTEITVVKQTHTQPSYALFPQLPGWAGARRNLLHFVVQGKITEADTWTTQVGATPSGLISDPPSSSPYFLCQMPFLPQPSHFILAWDRHQMCWLAHPVAWFTVVKQTI